MTEQTARHISVSICRPPQTVYAFASNPRNLPQWATGLCDSVEQVAGEWVANSPMGKVKIRFAEKNQFGILDHDVALESGEVFHNPMRVVPAGDGSEVIFSLIWQPGMTSEKFEQDAQWVEKDLNRLKTILELDHRD